MAFGDIRLPKEMTLLSTWSTSIHTDAHVSRLPTPSGSLVKLPLIIRRRHLREKREKTDLGIGNACQNMNHSFAANTARM